MSLTALLARCLLALALVANGLPAMAMPTVVEPEPAAATSCHDIAADHVSADESAPAAAGMDCCDSGDCACSCLHHAPVVLGLAFLPATTRPHDTTAVSPPRIAPGPVRSPSLRPPIIG